MAECAAVLNSEETSHGRPWGGGTLWSEKQPEKNLRAQSMLGRFKECGKDIASKGEWEDLRPERKRRSN